jgi:hypothetical protein
VTAQTTTKALIESQTQAALDPWGRKKNRAALDAHKEIAAKLNAEARENWDNEAWHRQVAADVASTLDYGFTFDNFFSQWIDTETVGEWDRVILRERRGMKVFYTSRGGYIDESQIRNEEWELPRDTMGFHVSEHIDKLRANFATTITDLTTLGQARMEAEVNRRILTLAQTAVPSTSPNYVATSGLSQADLDAAITAVRDSIQPNGVGMVPVSIIGRAAMIDKIAGFLPTFSPIAIEEVRQRGFIGHYKGAQVIVLNHYVDEDNISYAPANELWVFGGTMGKFALYGGLQVKSWDENTVDYRHYRARKDIGGLINHPEQVRRIVDSSVTP